MSCGDYDKVLVLPPLNPRFRYLTHSLVNRYFISLKSVSIGLGTKRRTVIWMDRSKFRKDLASSVDSGRKQKEDVSPHRTTASCQETRSKSGRGRGWRNQKRPDQQFYVPGALRKQKDEESMKDKESIQSVNPAGLKSSINDITYQSKVDNSLCENADKNKDTFSDEVSLDTSNILVDGLNETKHISQICTNKQSRIQRQPCSILDSNSNSNQNTDCSNGALNASGDISPSMISQRTEKKKEHDVISKVEVNKEDCKPLYDGLACGQASEADNNKSAVIKTSLSSTTNTADVSCNQSKNCRSDATNMEKIKEKTRCDEFHSSFKDNFTRTLTIESDAQNDSKEIPDGLKVANGHTEANLCLKEIIKNNEDHVENTCLASNNGTLVNSPKTCDLCPSSFKDTTHLEIAKETFELNNQSKDENEGKRTSEDVVTKGLCVSNDVSNNLISDEVATQSNSFIISTQSDISILSSSQLSIESTELRPSRESKQSNPLTIDSRQLDPSILDSTQLDSLELTPSDPSTLDSTQSDHSNIDSIQLDPSVESTKLNPIESALSNSSTIDSTQINPSKHILTNSGSEKETSKLKDKSELQMNKIVTDVTSDTHRAPRDDISSNLLDSSKDATHSEVREKTSELNNQSNDINESENKSDSIDTKLKAEISTNKLDKPKKKSKTKKSQQTGSKEDKKNKKTKKELTNESEESPKDKHISKSKSRKKKEKDQTKEENKCHNKEDEKVADDNNCHENDDGDDGDDDESWFSKFNEDGECLDPTLLKELSKETGIAKPAKHKTQFDFYSLPEKEIQLDEGFGHIVEIYDFSPDLKTQDLTKALAMFKDQSSDIKWVDDTHALASFSSPLAANQAIQICSSPLLKLRPINQGIAESKKKASRCFEFLQPCSNKPRPQTTALAAHRLVTGALGVKSSMTKEEKQKERDKLKEAKELKRQEKQRKADVWGE